MLKPAPYAMPVERALFYAGWMFTALVLLFLIAPILAVIPLSFNAEPYFSYPMPGLSLQWYRDFFGNERWTGALALSVTLPEFAGGTPALRQMHFGYYLQPLHLNVDDREDLPRKLLYVLARRRPGPGLPERYSPPHSGRLRQSRLVRMP